MVTLKKQQGVALITALLVVSLATVLAISLIDHLHFDIRRTENILRLDQAQLYNNNAVDFGMVLLRLDRDANNEYDSKEDIALFNEQAAMFPVDGGSVSAHISDLQSCFNLNNLSKTNEDLTLFRTQYTRLLKNAGIEETELIPLTDSLIDWLDEDDVTEPMGAEFDYYIGLERPYRTANDIMITPSELRLVKGYTADIIKQLKDYICVLPAVKTGININTASSIVLESIDGLQGHGNQIITDRDGAADSEDDQAPFDDLGAFKSYVKNSLNVSNFNSDNLQIFSEYFLLETNVQLGAGNIKLYSMIFRNQKDSNTSLLRQARGSL